MPGLVNIVGQRLLAIHVLAQVHRQHTGRGMSMIGRAHQHGVDLFLHAAEHLAEVDEGTGLGPAACGAGQEILIDVAEGHDVLAATGVVVGRSPIGNAHAGDIQLALDDLARSRAGAGDAAAPKKPVVRRNVRRLVPLAGDIGGAPGRMGIVVCGRWSSIVG